MLRRPSKIVSECHRRALEAAERAAGSSSREDRPFSLHCEQRWLDHAKREDSERLDEFVQSRSRARDIADSSEPTAEETLRLVTALNSIFDPDKRDELFRLVEHMAGTSPRFAEFLLRTRPKN